MKNHGLNVIIVCLAMSGVPGTAHADTRSVLEFSSPHSQCMKTPAGRIITSVGKFPDSGYAGFEVVADTRLKPISDSPTEFEDPSISIFGRHCRLVWHQNYPSLGEVGFEDLRLPGKSMLLVSAISVFQPVDQVISDQELLSSNDKTIDIEAAFGSDRYDASYIGPLAPDGQFGIVIVSNANPATTGFDTISPAITGRVFRWRAFVNPTDPAASVGYHFVGPEQIDARAIVALKLHWDKGRHPPFPLYQFVFGEAAPH